MSTKRAVWFQKNAQQGIFMKVSTIPALVRSGPIQAVTDNQKQKPSNEKYFIVGETLVGGEEVVGS